MDDLQRKYDTQVAISELLKMLKGTPGADGAAAAAAPSGTVTVTAAMAQPPSRAVSSATRGQQKLFDPQNNDLSFERDWDWDTKVRWGAGRCTNVPILPNTSVGAAEHQMLLWQ